MNSKEFWGLIEVALEKSGGDEERQASLLVAALVALGASAIITFGTFYKRFAELVVERADIEGTDLINVIKGEHYLVAFAHWLVGQGESEFYRGLAANDAHDYEQVRDIGYAGTPLEYVVPTAYYECTGHDHPDWLGFSEYLAADSGTAEATRAHFDEPDLHDWGAPLHDLSKTIMSLGYDLDGDVMRLMIAISDLYYRMPTWKRSTRAGTLLVEAGNLIDKVNTLLYEGFGGESLSRALTFLVPNEPLRAPEGSNAT